MRYSIDDRKIWIKLRSKGLGYCEISTEFKKMFPSKRKSCYKTIRKLIEKFELTGSVQNKPYHRKNKISKDTEMNVLAYIEVNFQI